jgi:phosphatidylserine/phosphatidylglycerophosphate/cardiolipin synthase-like enzyme
MESFEIRGRLVAVDNSGFDRGPLEGHTVFIKRDVSLLDQPEWFSGLTDAAGFFNFTRGPAIVAGNPIQLGARTSGGRNLRIVANGEVTDTTDHLLNIGDVQVREDDARGPWVTLNTGGAERRGTGSVTFLMDHEAFRYAAAMLRNAGTEILASQLFFTVPKAFNAVLANEEPGVIFDFRAPNAPNTSPGFDLAAPRALNADDSRPYRLIVDASNRGVNARVLLNSMHVPMVFRIIFGALLFPRAFTRGVSYLRDMLDKDLTDADECLRYFADAKASRVKVRAFEQQALSAGVMHAKLLAVDGRVLSIGSPFEQTYVDNHEHRIDAWIRGATDGYPKHDAGFAVTGDAAGELYTTMKLLWENAGTGDVLPTAQPHSPDQSPRPRPVSVLDDPADGVCDMQVVRTLSQNRFKKIDGGDGAPGEKGILEAYQRAIATAKDFVYLETQYFTNDAIAFALVARMLEVPTLQVIVLLNIEPDTPLYPFKQRRLITRIRRQIEQTDDGPQRFGVFTRWTHELASPRPRLIPVYIHAKVGIVDNTWATVGSANLDGFSLDGSYPSDWLRRRRNNFTNSSTFEQRAIEVNAVMRDFSDTHTVDVLRRKLWAEHLGYVDPTTGDPVITARDIQAADRPPSPGPDDPPPQLDPADPTRPFGGWLQLWHGRARATLDHLKHTPRQPLTGKATVLPWPEDDTTHKWPRDHLSALGFPRHSLVALIGTRPFDFKTGDWKPRSRAPADEELT